MRPAGLGRAGRAAGCPQLRGILRSNIPPLSKLPSHSAFASGAVRARARRPHGAGCFQLRGILRRRFRRCRRALAHHVRQWNRQGFGAQAERRRMLPTSQHDSPAAVEAAFASAARQGFAAQAARRRIPQLRDILRSNIPAVVEAPSHTTFASGTGRARARRPHGAGCFHLRDILRSDIPPLSKRPHTPRSPVESTGLGRAGRAAPEAPSVAASSGAHSSRCRSALAHHVRQCGRQGSGAQAAQAPDASNFAACSGCIFQPSSTLPSHCTFTSAGANWPLLSRRPHGNGARCREASRRPPAGHSSRCRSGPRRLRSPSECLNSTKSSNVWSSR